MPPFSAGDRISFFDGTRLDALDLRDLAQNQSRLRGLHVRASHNTWGVAIGFAVTRPSPQLLRIGPGLAYDAHGREIVSTETLDLGAPVLPSEDADAWWFDLVISYDETLGEDRFGSGCLTAPGAIERPRWRWCYVSPAVEGVEPPLAATVRLGRDVPLVRCRISREGIDPDLDFSLRRQAQGAVRPHVAGGQIGRSMNFDSALAAFTTTIDASAGGFNQTPFYFAQATLPGLLTTTESEQELRVGGPFVSIRAPSRTSFQVDIRLVALRNDEPTFSASSVTVTVGDQARLPAIITWTGIEPNGGCPPPLHLVANLALFLQPVFAFERLGVSNLLGTNP